eukprot:scaffold14286_cov21-Tisochrysis_lutea.AAC.8
MLPHSLVCLFVTQVVCGQGAAKAFGAEAPCAGSAGAKPWSESYEEGDLGQVRLMYDARLGVTVASRPNGALQTM